MLVNSNIPALPLHIIYIFNNFIQSTLHTRHTNFLSYMFKYNVANLSPPIIRINHNRQLLP